MPTLVVNPKRPGRWCPRVLKYTTLTFPKMTRERHEYRLLPKVKKRAA